MDNREKQIRLMELEGEMLIPPDFADYYDYESDALIDEKIKVLEQLEKGKVFESIPGAIDILEKYPKGAPGEDYVI